VIEPDIKPESTVLWTFERMMEKTRPYCRLMMFDQPIEIFGLTLNGGWFMSDEAVEDMDRFLGLN